MYDSHGPDKLRSLALANALILNRYIGQFRQILTRLTAALKAPYLTDNCCSDGKKQACATSDSCLKERLRVALTYPDNCGYAFDQIDHGGGLESGRAAIDDHVHQFAQLQPHFKRIANLLLLVR